jgi:type I restriction enzyme S subunit
MVVMNQLIKEISMGPFGSDIKVDNYTSSGVPVLNGANVSSVKLIENSFNYVTHEKAKSLKKANAKRGDIVITHRGTLGQICYIPEDSKFENYVISQSQFRVTLKTDLVDPRYFVYYFHTSEGQKRLLANKSYVGVPALAQATSNFRLIDFPLPELKEQKKIADILSTHDAKIELNNRINAELESLAKTIYDYWFVQFDFPNADGKPYKSSGGEMVYVEKGNCDRAIPAGWEMGILRDLVEFNYGKPLKTEARSGSGYPVVGSSGVIGYHSEFLIKASGVVVGRKGTIGAITYLHENFYPIDTTYYVKPKKNIKLIFIYFLLRTLRLDKMNGDSAVPGLNREVALNVPISLPSLELIQKFESLIEPMFNKTKNIQNENQQLTQLRDWLLPMLMNGQVSIK